MRAIITVGLVKIKNMNNDSPINNIGIDAHQNNPSKPIISARSITKVYSVGHQKINALNGVTIDVQPGEFVALVGASGSGKSTLLQLIGGLDRPTSGSIEVNGEQLTKMADRKMSIFRNRTLGFIFQSFYLQPFLNVRRNIEISAMPSRMKRKTRDQQVESIAKRLGLSDRLNHLPNELSGGQIQRVAIARALLGKPNILLADEPTGNLDVQNSHEIVAIFRQIRREIGTTIIVATHDQQIASQADRIIKISDGKIEYDKSI